MTPKSERRPLPPVPQSSRIRGEIVVLHLHKYDTSRPLDEPIQYLHTRRLAKYAYRDEWLDQVRAYYDALGELTEQFVQGVIAAAGPDLVVQAPSNDPSADPYFAGLALRAASSNVRRHLWVKDKSHSAGAGDRSDAGAEYEAIKWRGPTPPSLGSFRRVVIVDDVFAAGKTMAATWARLHEAGLPLDAAVIAGVPLLV